MRPASIFKVVRLAQVLFEVETSMVDRPTNTVDGVVKLRPTIKLLLFVETTNLFVIFEVLRTYC